MRVTQNFDNTVPISSEVTQASTVGPLVSVLFVDDKTICIECPMYLHADDTKVLAKSYDKFIQLIDLFMKSSSLIHRAVYQTRKKSIVFNSAASDCLTVCYENVPAAKNLGVIISKGFKRNTHFLFMFQNEKHSSLLMQICPF